MGFSFIDLLGLLIDHHQCLISSICGVCPTSIWVFIRVKWEVSSACFHFIGHFSSSKLHNRPLVILSWPLLLTTLHGAGPMVRHNLVSLSPSPLSMASLFLSYIYLDSYTTQHKQNRPQKENKTDRQKTKTNQTSWKMRAMYTGP